MMRARLEAWMIAGTGDDKTDIVIIADFYDRAAIYSRDRNITSNANAIPIGADLIIAARIFPVSSEHTLPCIPSRFSY